MMGIAHMEWWVCLLVFGAGVIGVHLAQYHGTNTRLRGGDFRRYFLD